VANTEHLEVLRHGVDVWNNWRKDDINKIIPDFQAADLRSADLRGVNFLRAVLALANLGDANLTKADLSRAMLYKTNLCNASLRDAHLVSANFSCADLRGADLRGASLFGAMLHGTNLSEADLREADLRSAVLVETNLERANLSGCLVYGTSAWGVKLGGAIQYNLVITPQDEPAIQVDNLEVAQFIYLLLNNQKIRGVIDAITSKVVLILGRFTSERKPILEALREELRKRGYSPVLFDFDKPASQTTVETISTLAHMARFVFADITDAKSVLQELQAIVPLSPSVVIQPLLLASQQEPGMFDFLEKFPWVLDTYRYVDQRGLLAELGEKLIASAEAKVRELGERPPRG
jgi:hypothetical protein